MGVIADGTKIAENEKMENETNSNSLRQLTLQMTKTAKERKKENRKKGISESKSQPSSIYYRSYLTSVTTDVCNY